MRGGEHGHEAAADQRRHTIPGMGGGFTYYRITDAGLALIPE